VTISAVSCFSCFALLCYLAYQQIEARKFERRTGTKHVKPQIFFFLVQMFIAGLSVSLVMLILSRFHSEFDDSFGDSIPQNWIAYYGSVLLSSSGRSRFWGHGLRNVDFHYYYHYISAACWWAKCESLDHREE
jgi:hypothetical protein